MKTSNHTLMLISSIVTWAVVGFTADFSCNGGSSSACALSSMNSSSRSSGTSLLQKAKRTTLRPVSMSAHVASQVQALTCQKSFWLTLTTCVDAHNDGTTFVRTGDIPSMWIRDSAAQMHPYITTAIESQRLQELLEGTLRSQAKYIMIDPYANSFVDVWKPHVDASAERLLRGGYVGTANFEMDSGAYFFKFLENYVSAVPSSAIVGESQIHAACRILLDVYLVERDHNRSEYKYPASAPFELPGGAKGNSVGYTGMVWNAFRPSDDPHIYGYHIPGNVFLASTLPFVEQMAATVWNDTQLEADANDLRRTILRGVEQYGKHSIDGHDVYCYEVDGFGHCNLMDDANIPSLLSLPYLDPTGTSYSPEVYKNTRNFVLSTKNPWYFEGSAGKGIGSPHTGAGMIWPLSLIMQAMTASTREERDQLLKSVVDTATGGTLHESFHKDDPAIFTRKWFAWPNALLVESVRSTGASCGSLREAPPFPVATPRDLSGVALPSGNSFYSAEVSLLRYRPTALHT